MASRLPLAAVISKPWVLYRLLSADAEVRLWATSSKVSGELMRHFPICRISVPKRNVPDGGTYVFLGAHWRNKIWPYLIPRPRRLIYVFNTFHPKVIALTTRMPRMLIWPDAELVGDSDFQKRMLRVDPSDPPERDPFDGLLRRGRWPGSR